MSVPKLRFPEFRDDAEWGKKLLKKVIQEFRKKSTVQDEYEVLTSSRGGLIRQKDYYDNNSITDRDNVGFNVIPPNYLTYRSRSDDNLFFFNENKLGITGIISSYYPVFQLHEGCRHFFVYLLQYFAKYVGKYSIGTSQTVLSLNVLKSIELPFPKNSEQQKIAACLTSLDDLISVEGSKLDSLKNHKQGLMQQLFPSEIESVPSVRFEGFEEDWGERKLGELASKINQKNKGSKVTRVLTNSASNGIVDQRDYFDKDIANQNNLDGYYVVDKGDYVYNPRISTVAPVGPISKNMIGMGVMSPLYTVFRFKNRNNSFYEQFFKTNQWHTYLKVMSNSGARHDRMSIATDDFMAMPLPEPSSSEQQKIAACLSSLDDLITAQAAYIDTLKQHKKGLMQQLFPTADEAAT